MLYFQDESAVSLAPVLGTTWSPKGKTPKVKVTGNLGSIAVSSATSSSALLLPLHIYLISVEVSLHKEHIPVR